MKALQYSLNLDKRRKFIRKEMQKNKLTPSQLAGLSDLGPVTVLRFLEGSTGQPADRTVLSLFDALGYDVIEVPRPVASAGKFGS